MYNGKLKIENGKLGESMLKNKVVVVGVTGSIAAYKSAQLVSDLVKEGCEVHVIMTKNALNFINPITFETLTGRKCLVDTFDRNFEYSVTHVSLSQKADIFMIAPASANIIGKIANGIADDMLSTMVMAAKCPVLIAPAMNKYMFMNSIVQENIEKLKRHGYKIISPAVGRLACNDTGIGKLPDVDILIEHIKHEIANEKDYKGLKVLVTAGATQESLDPVRYITNHSTGKMGYAIAQAASERGAEVTLVSGEANIKPPVFAELIKVKSAEDMFNAVKENLSESDAVIMAAAVADYTPDTYSNEKIKKSDSDMSISLKRTRDILKYAGENKRDKQVICGFSMETENLLENSRKKLEKKNCDIIAANSIKEKGAGFGTDTNIITLITKDSVYELDKMSKYDAANIILDRIKQIFSEK